MFAPPSRRAPRYSSPVGFTLVELMIAVVILGVLATLAGVAYGRQVRKGRLGNMNAMMLEIASKQEQYQGFTGRYAGSTADAFCPANVRASATDFLVGICGNAAVFNELGVTVPRSTYFQYQILAGEPGTACTKPSATGLSSAQVCGRIDPNTHWWVVVARADQDGDGRHAEFVTDSTMNGTIFRVNETE